MADRFPLILNTSANQIQEIASGDTLDLTGNNISNAGVITATSFSGPIVAGAGTSNITAGIITAVTFKGDGDFFDIDVDGDTNLDNVTITGVSTFAGAIDLNSDLDVDGHTNLDNVSIAGVVTATTFSGSGASLTGIANVNVASNAAIAGSKITPNFGSQTMTAGLTYVNGLQCENIVMTHANPHITFNDSNHNHNYKIQTQTTNLAVYSTTENATRLQISANGNVSIYKDLDVDGHTNLDNVSIAGFTTVTQDLDVDGHTNLDNVNVVGVLTVTGAVNASHSTFGNLNTTGITIQNTNATILFNDTNNNPDYRAAADNGVFDIDQYNNGGSDINVVKINTDGHIDIGTNVDFAAGIDVTGNATVSGNLSVGGVLTYEDVTNVDSVGIVTARNGIKVLAGGANVVGVVTATTLSAGNIRITDDGASGPLASIMADDGNPWALQIGNSTYSTSYSTGHQFFVASGNGNAFHEVRSSTTSYNDYVLRVNNSANTSKNCIKIDGSDQSVVLYAGGVDMLQTTSTGATLLGELNATGANFTDDGQSSPIVSIMSDDANPWGIQVGNSTYNSSTIFGWQVYVNNAGEGYQYHIGSGAYKDFHFYQHDQSQSKLMIKFEADDNSVELYAAGNKKLETTSSGVTVTGVCNATSFTGDGSGLSGISVGISTEQVTPSSNVATLNLAKDDHKIVASGTYTIDVSGGSEASTHTLRIENSGTANVGFSTYFKFPSGGTPSLPTASGAISLVSFSVHKVGSVGIATVLLAGASVNFS